MNHGISPSKWAPSYRDSTCSTWAGAWPWRPRASAPSAADPSGGISMAFAAKYRQLGIALLVIASAAVLVWFGNGINPLWPLLWFAPLPILLFALHSGWRSAAVVAFLAGLIGGLNLW